MCTKLSLSRRRPYRVPALITRPGLTSPSDLKPLTLQHLILNTTHKMETKLDRVSEDLRCFKC